MSYKTLFAAALIAGSALPAAAANFSFTGALPNENAVLRFDFSLTGTADVTFRTYSYAGGTNSAGQAIGRGGFDPILSVYNASTNARVDQNDDGGSSVPADIDGLRYDTFLTSSLTAGSYAVLVSMYNNFLGANLNDPFAGVSPQYLGGFRNTQGEVRSPNWAFDILNATSATCTQNCGGDTHGNDPEPGTLALFGIAALGLGARSFAKSRRA